MVPAVAQIKSGTRACSGRLLRSVSLPLATIWSCYLHLAGEPQNTNTRAEETLTGVCGSLRDPDGGKFIALHGGFPPPTPSFRHAEQGSMKK